MNKLALISNEKRVSEYCENTELSCDKNKTYPFPGVMKSPVLPAWMALTMTGALFKLLMSTSALFENCSMLTSTS